MSAPSGKICKLGSAMFGSILWNFARRTAPKIYTNARFMSSDVEFLSRGSGKAIAYRSLKGSESPGIIFCPGFQSNMEGTKAMAIEEYCRAKKHPYTRFDYQGCGHSEGDIRKVKFSEWRDDVISIIDQITAGPQLLVGSSMGVWLMFLAALERSHRIHSMVAIAAAPDFAQRAFANFPKEVLDALEHEGEALIQSEYGVYVLTKPFMDDARNYSLLQQDSIPIRCPVRFLHGMADKYVPYDMSLQLANKIQSHDVLVLLRKKGDHRFSQPDDIQVLFEELDYLIQGSREARQLAIESWSSFSMYSRPERLLRQSYRAGDQPQNWPKKSTKKESV